jgi:pyridoxal phosphate phosphatase PHOSPHO2
MVSLLKEIHKRPKTEKELLIISDANDVFISAFLSSIDVVADAIISNRSSITPQGQLLLQPYEDQDTCPICPRNLCKGAALDHFLDSAQAVS